MTAAVLLSNSEIDTARDALRHMGASCIAPWPIPLLRRLGILGGVNLGDRLKSWDILTTATFSRSGFRGRHRFSTSAPTLQRSFAPCIAWVTHP